MDMQLALSKYQGLGEKGVELFRAELQRLNNKAEEEVSGIFLFFHSSGR